MEEKNHLKALIYYRLSNTERYLYADLRKALFCKDYDKANRIRDKISDVKGKKKETEYYINVVAPKSRVREELR